MMRGVATLPDHRPWGSGRPLGIMSRARQFDALTKDFQSGVPAAADSFCFGACRTRGRFGVGQPAWAGISC